SANMVLLPPPVSCAGPGNAPHLPVPAVAASPAQVARDEQGYIGITRVPGNHQIAVLLNGYAQGPVPSGNVVSNPPPGPKPQIQAPVLEIASQRHVIRARWGNGKAGEHDLAVRLDHDRIGIAAVVRSHVGGDEAVAAKPKVWATVAPVAGD